MPRKDDVGLKLQAWLEAPEMTLVNLGQMVALKVRPQGDDGAMIVGHGSDGKEWILARDVPREAAYLWLAKAAQALNAPESGGWALGVVVPIG